MPNDEPSVLDYLKSRLKFWKRAGKVELPSEPTPPGPEKPEEPAPPVHEFETAPIPVQPEPGHTAETHQAAALLSRPWPWRSLLALALALAAQRLFEPPGKASAGLYLYLLSAAFLGWAILRREWTLADFPAAEEHEEPFTIRRLPFILSIPLAGLAFLLFTNNMFTPVNVTLWALATLAFVWSVWLPGVRRAEIWSRLRSFFTRKSWQLNLTRWGLLVLAVAALVTFFRVYRISSVPGEPFSDHAEKLLDVYDVTQGQTHIFFPRNTGREAIQMYLTVAVAWIFGTGLSFLSLKLDTVIAGLATMPFLYLLGKEFGNKRIALLAVLFAGIAYWPNVISRVGLRFTLYPFFVAPTLYYLIRGLRTHSRNDFILSGLFLGAGLHGYTAFRIMPIVVVIAFGLYLLHRQAQGGRLRAVVWLGLVSVTSLYVFLPLARYWQENPDIFTMRAFSRLGTPQNPVKGPVWQVFLSNTWNALRMFNWDDGNIWVHSVTHRPALDVVSGALFLLGSLLILIRYLRQRRWLDLFLLLSVPLLQLPSILALAFPAENPALNRAAGAFVPTFLIVAIALDGLLTTLAAGIGRRAGPAVMWLVAAFLVVWSASQNYDLVFNQYNKEFTQGSWNTSEMGAVIKQFAQVYGSSENAWVVPYPYWVDTRLPGVWAGIPNRDFALWPQDFSKTQSIQGAKLFIIDTADGGAANDLEKLYPQGVISTFHSATKQPGKDFWILFVPPGK
jgi:hypothetical protein